MAGMVVMAEMETRRNRDQGGKKRQQLPEEFSGSVCVIRRFYGLLIYLFISRKSAQKSLLSPCWYAQREGGKSVLWTLTIEGATGLRYCLETRISDLNTIHSKNRAESTAPHCLQIIARMNSFNKLKTKQKKIEILFTSQ